MRMFRLSAEVSRLSAPILYGECVIELSNQSSFPILLKFKNMS